MRVSSVLPLVMALAYLVPSHLEAAGTQLRCLRVDGRARTYLVHAPATLRTDTPAPMVMVLHGHGGTASKAMRMSRMNAKADEAGFLAVYPNGTSWANTPWRSWNAGSCCGYGKAKGMDDVTFLRKVIEDLERTFPIDEARIYVTGVSNGGMMAYRAACELSEYLAAIAPVAGALGVAACQPSQPVSVIIFHGTEDRYVPYAGGRSSVTMDNRVDPPVAATAKFWAEQDHCAAGTQQQVQGRVVHAWFPDCAQGSAVELYTIQGGGHAWPGGRRAWPFGDRPTRELSATDIMWEFFASHPKASRKLT